MKTEELKTLVNEDINNRINDAKQELMNLKFRLVSGNLKDYTQVRQIRHKVARLNTVLSERIKEGKNE